MESEGVEKEFDYQTTLESCSLLVELCKTADEQNTESESQFYEEFDAHKEVKKERHQQKRTFNSLKLAYKKNSLKAENMRKELNAMKEQMANYLRQNEDLHLQMQKLSNELTESILAIDVDLEKLKSEFEDSALSVSIKNITNDLLSYRDAEYQLEDCLKTEMLSKDSKESEIDTTVQDIPFQLSDADKKYKDPAKTIIDKEKNIQFLTNEYKKNEEMIKNLEMQ